MSDDEGAPNAGLRTHTLAAGTMWLTQTPALSLWKGEVGLADWLRVETRDGRVLELPLPAPGPLRIGRPKPGMAEPPDVAHELFTSSQAALFTHDGVRWWLTRRRECHERVPVVVGARVLGDDESAPVVHGTFVQIGKARGTLVDRRYVASAVPAGVVDAHTGMLGRAGFEQEIAGFVALGRQGAIVVLAASAEASIARPGEHPPLVRGVAALHRAWPRAAIMHDEGVLALLVPSDVGHPLESAAGARAIVSAVGVTTMAVGFLALSGERSAAARDLELATSAARSALATGMVDRVLSLAEGLSSRLGTPAELSSASAEKRRGAVLFSLEETAALSAIGSHVVPGLEQELGAVVAGRAPPRSVVARLAPGVVGVALPGNEAAEPFAADVQREWHSRPPIVDGAVEFPRSLAFETTHAEPVARAAQLSRECADPSGVLGALAGGLPLPIAGRVAMAEGATSAVERVKLLFDVLEGAWRFVAVTLAAAYLAPTTETAQPAGWDELAGFARGMVTRGAYPLGKWRELARLVAKGLGTRDDPMGRMARELLRVRHAESETLEQLANQLHPLRNQFAHTTYPEARARQDLAAFEQSTRELLRALRPLAAWTLVTIERADPDPYGDTQRVEYVDHTGPAATGTRRRVGLKSPVRLASVVYVARLREGLVVPLEPFVRRVARGHSFDLVWIQHLPRAGACSYAGVVDGEELTLELDERRMSPLLRALVATLAR